MNYTWRCQKCFRYLATINSEGQSITVTQRTICPRCKSENKITINSEVIINSCGFSSKFASNLTREKATPAPKLDGLLTEKIGKEICMTARIVKKESFKISLT